MGQTLANGSKNILTFIGKNTRVHGRKSVNARRALAKKKALAKEQAKGDTGWSSRPGFVFDSSSSSTQETTDQSSSNNQQPPQEPSDFTPPPHDPEELPGYTDGGFSTPPEGSSFINEEAEPPAEESFWGTGWGDWGDWGDSDGGDGGGDGGGD